MRAPAPNPPSAAHDDRARSPFLALVIAVLLFALGVGGGIAYVTADPGPSARREMVAEPPVTIVDPAPPVAPPLPVVPVPPVPGAQRAGAPPSPEASAAAAAAVLAALAPARQAPADIVQQVTEEAQAQLESYRPKIMKECWPSEGLPRGASTAKLTIHSTFDAQGREIARGITEDRRAPGGAFASCLRKLPTALSVSGTGRRVAVAIPLTYP
jgi:hypothetical protein